MMNKLLVEHMKATCSSNEKLGCQDGQADLFEGWRKLVSPSTTNGTNYCRIT